MCASKVASDFTPKMLTMGNQLKSVQRDVNVNTKELIAMRTIVKPSKKGFSNQKSRNSLAIDMSVSVFKDNSGPNIPKLRALLTSCYTKGLYLEPAAGIETLLYIHQQFG